MREDGVLVVIILGLKQIQTWRADNSSCYLLCAERISCCESIVQIGSAADKCKLVVRMGLDYIGSPLNLSPVCIRHRPCRVSSD